MGGEAACTGRDQAGVKITLDTLNFFGDEREMRATMSEIVNTRPNICIFISSQSAAGDAPDDVQK